MVGPPVDFKASGPCRLLPIALPHRSDSRLYGYVMKPPEVSIKRPPQLAASNSRNPAPPPPTQTYGDDLPRRFCIFPPWADISFSNARSWARMCSTGFRRPRRTSPVPMPTRPSSASPAPGFISSTSKPANFSARTDAAASSVPARTQGWLKFTFVLFPRNGILRSA